eukprot:TRINITY_DN4551_c0_g2_i1.p1 TRINITY_DN4551_c0_g2~~TRINITY_DN4551_c0_g2_i1.p1  ORF type:complete len:223 (-),score=39.21 TRINITY_DN4551_c0_g2_i1:97-765(-)
MNPTIINNVSHPALVVMFLHGLGGSGMSWEQMVKPIAPFFPQVKFILPSATSRSVTVYGGQHMPSWYDILSFDPDHPEDEDGVKESSHGIQNLLNAEIAKGISSKKILLAGASQGGAVALYSGLTFDKPLAGILALSTYLPLHKNFPKVINEANRNTKLLMCHGEDDEVVKFAHGKKTYEHLKPHLGSIELKSYKGMGHSSCPQEMMDILAFLGQVLAEANK